ncbi:MAG: cobalamin B12-binding domain-containing protein [Hyphomonadaceae bacterium]|nr:cobalamin B12-binding domain-containing protein [Hyphomonadaceae bacterium]
MDKSERYDRAVRVDVSPMDDFAFDLSCPSETPQKPPNPANDLLKTIETDILPRLMLVHASEHADRLEAEPAATEIDDEQVTHFVWLMTDQSASSGQDFVDALLRTGTPIERIYLDLFAPAARRMGEFWEQDTRSFTDVTIGLCRLHELLRHNTINPTRSQMVSSLEAPTILLSTACEDQHVFGILMVAEFFRKEGWQVRCEPGASTKELARIVSDRSFDVIGLSIARSVAPDEITRVIQKVRKSSRNKDTKIFLGGALVQRDQSIAQAVGADGVSIDASQAPSAAKRLLADTRVGC